MRADTTTISYCILGRSMSYYVVEVDGLFAAIWGQGGVEDEHVPELIAHRAIVFSDSDKTRVINFINQSEEVFRREHYPTIPLEACYYKGKRGRKSPKQIFIHG